MSDEQIERLARRLHSWRTRARSADEKKDVTIALLVVAGLGAAIWWLIGTPEGEAFYIWVTNPS